MIGDRIKNIRKKCNLTQSELASIVGVSDVTINRYEKGLRHPKYDKILKIAELGNVTTHFILHGVEENNITISIDEYTKLKEIEKKYNKIKTLVNR